MSLLKLISNDTQESWQQRLGTEADDAMLIVYGEHDNVVGFQHFNTKTEGIFRPTLLLCLFSHYRPTHSPHP